MPSPTRTSLRGLVLCALPLTALGGPLSACGGDLTRSPPSSPDPVALSAVPLVEPPTLPVEALPFDRVVGPNGGPESERRDLPSVAALEALGELPTTEIHVRTGETLVVLADQAGATAEVLAALNGLEVTRSLRVGQGLLLPVDHVDADTIQARRDAGLARRLDRYLRGRGGLASVTTWRVRTGDTGTSIARDGVGAPLWVLAAYNPDVDLDHLSIGQELDVPVLADTLAAEESAAEDTAASTVAYETEGVAVIGPSP